MIHYEFPSDSQETFSVTQRKALPLSEETIIRVLNLIASHAA